MNRRFVSSLGEPYFAFIAGDMGDLSTLPGGGIVRIALTFRIDQVPPQLATADELHPLVAFTHDLPTKPTILAVGVTPSGRIKATNRAGDVFQTRNGLFGDASKWYQLEVGYDFLTPQWNVTLDGGIYSTPAAFAFPLLPDAGYNTRIMLFNGKDGISRTAASVSRLEVGFQGTDENIYTYSFDEGEGATLTPSKSRASGSGTFEMSASGVLSPTFYDPLLSEPYGPVPLGFSPAGAYRWGLATDYTRLPKPVTAYTRVAA